MIGIAVINYMTYSKTIECITSIRNTTKGAYRIYLLENGSDNESASILSNEYSGSSDVQLIISPVNHGYARGNNICIKYMRKDGCEYGLISNNDIICESDSIDKLVEDLKMYPDYLLVGPMICDPKGNFQRSVKLYQYTSIEYLFKSTYLSKFIKQAILNEDKKVSMIHEFREVSWVSGAFFAFDLEKFSQIGDFDSKTFLFFEEYILATKSKNRGFKLGYDPSVKIFHYHGASTGGGLNVKSKIAADKSERYYFANYTNQSAFFLGILNMIRTLEVVITFGKRCDFHSIKEYLSQMRQPL